MAELSPDTDTDVMVRVHTAELRILCDRLNDIAQDVKGLRADMYGRWPQCAVHGDRLQKLEKTSDRQTTESRAIGLLATLVAAIAAALGLGGKP